LTDASQPVTIGPCSQSQGTKTAAETRLIFGISILASIDKTSWTLVAIGLAGAMMVGAHVLEFVWGLDPCPLCVMQRIWIMVAGVIMAIGLAHEPRLGIYSLLAIAASVVGAGFSTRQLWLQSLPPDQVPSCGPDLAYMIEAFPLSDILIAMTSGDGNCAEVVWSFLGLSIPAWALIGFVVLIVTIVVQWRSP